MTSFKCVHHPHVVRITFDIGNNQTEVFELCGRCQEFEVFRDFVVDKIVITNDRRIAEVKFCHRTSANTSPHMEMIT